jgi:protein-disulfide isomerase
MNSRITAAIAVVGILAVGGVGYLVGTSQNRPAPTPADTAPAANATPANAALAKMAEFSSDQRKELEGIIRNYLIANPEVISDAIAELQRRRDAAAQLAQVKAIENSADAIFNAKDEVILGNPKGKVTLVEFFDYNCTYCRRAEADIKKLIAADPNLRLVLKQFPVLGPGSVEAAKVAVALQMTAPDKYADFHDAMLEEPGQTNGAKALAVAASLGLDPAVLKAKLDSDEVKQTINESYDLAGKLNLTGTPSFVTHKEVIVGAVGYDALKTKLDALASACTTDAC